MKARILVLNCFIKGWNILKSLADDGFEVNGGDYRPNAPGLFSNRIRDRSKNLIYPDPKTGERKFIESVIAHISRGKFDILLPVNAAEMMALARHRDEILKHALFPFESYYKLLLLHDKKYFYELLTANVDIEYLPRSWSVGNQTPPVTDVMEQADFQSSPCFQPMEDYPTVDHFLNANPGMVYPLMVKTRRATSAVGVYRARNENELRLACNNLGGVDIIIQENITGRGVGISSIRWNNPNIMHHFGHKRVREYPISGGASTSREPWDIDDHPLAYTIADLLEKLDWRGVVMFEFKEVEAENGQYKYKFLEANPRFWGSVPLAIANGVNFPVLLCRAATSMEIPRVVNRKNIRARILFSDTLSLVLNIFKGRRIAANLLDYFNFRNLYLDDIDLKDFPATLRVFGRMLSEFFLRLAKKRNLSQSP